MFDILFEASNKHAMAVSCPLLASLSLIAFIDSSEKKNEVSKKFKKKFFYHKFLPK